MSTTDTVGRWAPQQPNEPASSPLSPDPDSRSTLSPVKRGERIDFLDTARGFALLGILFVNIQSFGQPFGRFIEFRPDPGLVNHALFYFTKVLCEGKFYTLFSTLFGVGLAIQWTRAHRAGRSFAGVGVRRMLFLMGLGLAHGVLLWYGDVLLAYSICGLLILPALRWTPRTQLTIAAVVLTIATLLSAGMAAMMDPTAMSGPGHAAPAASSPAPFDEPEGPAPGSQDQAQPTSADPDADPEDVANKPRPESPALRLFDGYGRGDIKGGPEDPFWMEQETRAFKEGPWLDATMFRALLVGMILLFTLLGFGWGIIAMFLIGAALWKSGVVAGPATSLTRRLLYVGLPLGLCGSAIAVATGHLGGGAIARALAGLIALPSSVLVALGYFSGVKLWVESGHARGLARLLANVGRFGLTNYIMQTVICTFVFYHWGLAQFGEFTRAERFLMVLGVYIFQVVLSAGLVKILAYGPLEWVWRSFTYLRLQPLLRRGAARDDTGG